MKYHNKFIGDSNKTERYVCDPSCVMTIKRLLYQSENNDLLCY